MKTKERTADMVTSRMRPFMKTAQPSRQFPTDHFPHGPDDTRGVTDLIPGTSKWTKKAIPE